MTKIPRILIYSAAVRMDGGVDLNLGDEALSDCLVEGIRANVPDADVHRLVSIRGERVSLGSHEHSLRDLGPLLREVWRADVVVLGGGTLLQNDPGLLRWLAFISTFAATLRKPIVIAAVGAEGLQKRTLRFMARYACDRASVITVRDHASSVVIKRVSGREAEVVADPVLLVHSLLEDVRLAPAPVEGKPRTALIAVNLTREAPQRFVDALAERLTDRMSEGATVLGIAMDRRLEQDASALERLGQVLGWPDQYSVLSSEATWKEVCAVLAECEVCVGMRLHFLLLASIVSAPIVAVTSLPKTIAFAAEFDVASIGTEGSGTELQEAMSQAHAPRAEVLKSMGARAARTIEQIVAQTASWPRGIDHDVSG